MSKSWINNDRDVTVWLVDGRTVTDEKLLPHIAWLNMAEKNRYGRFARPQRQRQFLIGRVLLRLALAKSLQIRPQSIVFSERRGYSPLLIEPTGVTPGFSLSHSGPWVACAVGREIGLGLDIEVLDDQRDLMALAEQAFTGDEVAFLGTKSGKERVAAFYELWSKEEAAYKLLSLYPQAETSFTVLPHENLSIVLCSNQQLKKVSLNMCDVL